MIEKIAIFGAGGFGREVKMLIDQVNESRKQFSFIGYYDDGVQKSTLINGYPVLGGLDDLNKVDEDLNIVFAIGNPLNKRKIIEKLSNKQLKFPTLIHPTVLIGKDDVEIGEGTIICAYCIITVNIKIGRHVILNLACTVGHDTVVGDYSSFMPTINISGEVVIEEAVYGGTGAKIINQLTIGKDTIIGAGAVVAKSLPPKCTAVGIPAKPIKFHE
jgi:sugar O-acyltransferase (sialic acid O-acetyltransferase NeuD family)